MIVKQKMVEEQPTVDITILRCFFKDVFGLNDLINRIEHQLKAQGYKARITIQY